LPWTGPSCARTTGRWQWRRGVRDWKFCRHIYSSIQHWLLILPLLYLLHGSGVMPSKLSSSVSELQTWKMCVESDIIIPSSTQTHIVVIGYEVLGDRLVMTSVIVIIALDYIQHTTELLKVVLREICAITLMKCMTL
jgi:hypothetical protein